MGMLDEPTPLFTPQHRYYAKDNMRDLNAIGELYDLNKDA